MNNSVKAYYKANVWEIVNRIEGILNQLLLPDNDTAEYYQEIQAVRHGHITPLELMLGQYEINADDYSIIPNRNKGKLNYPACPPEECCTVCYRLRSTQDKV